MNEIGQDFAIVIQVIAAITWSLFGAFMAGGIVGVVLTMLGMMWILPDPGEWTPPAIHGVDAHPGFQEDDDDITTNGTWGSPLDFLGNWEEQ